MGIVARVRSSSRMGEKAGGEEIMKSGVVWCGGWKSVSSITDMIVSRENWQSGGVMGKDGMKRDERDDEVSDGHQRCEVLLRFCYAARLLAIAAAVALIGRSSCRKCVLLALQRVLGCSVEGVIAVKGT